MTAPAGGRDLAQSGKAAGRVLVVLGGVAAAYVAAQLVMALVLSLFVSGSLRDGYKVDGLNGEGVYLAYASLASLAAFIAMTALIVKLVYRRRPVDRALIVLAGYAGACIAASVLLAFIYSLAYVRSIVSGTDSHAATALSYLGMLSGFVLLGIKLVAVVALLPAMAIIIYAERRGIRSALFYGAAGAVVPQLVGVVFLILMLSTNPQMDAFAVPVWVMIFGPPGLVGGIAYWAIAGRRASGPNAPDPHPAPAGQLLGHELARSGRRMLYSRPMNTAADGIGDPFTEAGFRALARQGLHAAPSQAIFDPRSGRAWGPGDWDLNPELKGDLAVMAAAAAGRRAGADRAARRSSPSC